MNGAAPPSLGPCPHCGQPHAEDVLVCPTETKILPLEGRVLDSKFRFAKLLGAGGMGAVWRAQNTRVRKAVAIKLMHPEFAGNPGILDRFRNEATAAGQIGSQHICDIYDFGASVLGPYIVLEMLNGKSFGECIQEYTRVEPNFAAIVMRQALEGLEAAHKVGIVHRDLKPENIFLHEPTPGRLLVKLMDFGISKFSAGGNDGKTGVGVLMGTPEYMSPEQAEGAAGVDQRTDIWAMGAILYKALTGIEAFGGPTMASTLVALSTKEPKPIEAYAPHVPHEMVAVVRKCLAKDPIHRYQSARELSDALAPFEQLPNVMMAGAPAAPASFANTDPAGFHTNGPLQTPTGTLAAGAPATIITHHAPPPNQFGGPQPPPPGNPATFVGNLGAAAQTDDNWSIGAQATTRPPTLAGSPTGGSKIPLVILGLLFLVAIGGTGFFLMSGKPKGSGTMDGPYIEPATPAAPVAGTAGPVASATAGATPDPTAGATVALPDPTAGATAGTPDPTAGTPDPTAGTTPDPTAGATDPTPATTAGTDPPDDDDDDNKPTKLPPPKPDLSFVAQEGTLFTPKAPSDIVASVDEAKAACAGLKSKKFGKLTQWRLAKSGEVIKFQNTTGVQKLAYWVSDPVSAGRAKRVALVTGSVSEGDPKTFTRTRPFCVTKR